MKIKLLPLLLLVGIFGSSCKKDKAFEEVENKSISELTAPGNFTWSGSRDIFLSFGVSDNRFQNQTHVIKVYSADPAQGGIAISEGGATLTTPFNTRISLSSLINEVYIEKIAPDGSIVAQKVALNSNNVSLSIGATAVNQGVSATKLANGRSISVTPETAPSIPSNAIVIPTGTNNFVMAANTSYRVNSNSNVSFNDPGANAVLYVTGTNVTISSIEVKNSLTVIVDNDAVVNFSGNFNWNGASTFKNFGRATIAANVQPNGGTFRNQGTLTINQQYSSSNNASATNTGTMTVASGSNIGSPFGNSGTLTFNGSVTFKEGSVFTNTSTGVFKSGTPGSGYYIDITGTFSNAGEVTFHGAGVTMNGSNPTINNSGTFNANDAKLTVIGSFTNSNYVKSKILVVNSGGNITNSCKWYVTTTTQYDNQLNGPIQNNGYFEVSGGLNINTGGKITLSNGAMMVINHIEGFNEKINGTGTTSVLKINSMNNNHFNEVNNAANSGNIYSAAKFSNALQVVYPSNLAIGFFNAPAVQQKTGVTPVYIPVTPCMPVQNGTAPVVTDPDSDGDGRPDSQDPYKNDGLRTYKHVTLSRSTIAFEDSWPLKGDYDLNDVVMTYEYEIATDKNQKVTWVSGKYTLKATGGLYKNGAGVQFNLPAGSYADFVSTSTNSSKGTPYIESGHTDSLVLILFNDSRAQQANWNTVAGESYSSEQEFTFSFRVTNGPTIEAFGIGNYNPFIFNASAGNGRDYETHLFGKKPTSKANTSLFGTGNDASSLSGRLYGTSQNLPWAIQVPTGDFKYPVERTPITSAYLKFANWAITGGAGSSDWYIGTDGSYRDGSKLYNKPN